MKRLISITIIVVLGAAACSTKSAEKAPPPPPDAGKKVDAITQMRDEFVRLAGHMRQTCGLGLSVGRQSGTKGMRWTGRLIGPVRAKDWDGVVDVAWIRGDDGVWTCSDADSRSGPLIDGGPTAASPCQVVQERCNAGR